MFRLTIICLCATSLWASPSPSYLSKVRRSQLTGPRIVNGEEARDGEYPYQAAISFTGEDISSWFCSGSILNENWVLTAGHCVDGATSAQVRTGSVDPTAGDVSEASNIIQHPDFDGTTLAHDLGLIQLATPLTFNQNTEGIRLHGQAIEEGALLTVSGWGLTSDSDTTISAALNFVELVVITNSECEQAYGPGSILSEMVCAHSNTEDQKSICSGDSGAPGVVSGGGPQGPQQRSIAAVASFVSNEGCETRAPSGFTRIHDYVSWIEGIVNA